MHGGCVDTIKGKLGWLFQTAENILSLLATPAAPVDISSWAVMSAYRVEACRQLAGSEYVTLVCPEKASSYARMLPDTIHISDGRLAVTVAHILAERMLYPLDLLAWSEGEYLTYGPCESHWNDFGAYCVYKELMETFSRICKRELSIYPDPVFAMKDGGGYCDIGPPGERATWIPRNTKGRSIFDNLVWARGNVKICLNPDSTLPTLVLFRDSFANMLLPFLMESFSRIVAISSWNLMMEVVKQEKPDFVVCQIAERYMIPTSYTAFPSFRDLCKMEVSELDKFWRE